MKRWFGDSLFSSVLKNAGKLGSTKVLGGILGFVALYSAGKGMSAHDFGTLMLIMAYVKTVTELGQFQSWQIALHYGSVPWQKGDRQSVITAIRFAMGLDVCSSLLSTAGGMGALLLFGHRLGVYHEQRMLALFFCTQIPGMTASTVYGILRLFDRIDIVANQQIVEPVIRSTVSVTAWICGFGLPGFVLAWYLSQLAGQIYTWGAAWKELGKHNMRDALCPGFFKIARLMPKGVWRFAWTANLTQALDSVWEPVSCLMIGKELSPSAAGLFSLATTFLNAVKRPAALLEKSYYPEVVRLDPRSMKPWALALKTSFLSLLLAFIAMAVVYVGGRPVITLFGHRYGDAAILLQWMSPLLIFFMAGLPMEGVLYSAGRSGMIMFLQLASVFFYLPALYIGCHHGLEGAGLAYAAGVSVFNFLIIIMTLVTFLRRDHIIPPHEREIGQDIK